MPGRVFIDSNVLAYAQDARSAAKQRASRALISALAGSGDGVISTQVLQEFYVTATRKLGVPPLVAKGVLKTFAVFEIVQVSPVAHSGSRRLRDLESAVVLGLADSGGRCVRRLLDGLQRRPQPRSKHPWGHRQESVGLMLA